MCLDQHSILPSYTVGFWQGPSRVANAAYSYLSESLFYKLEPDFFCIHGCPKGVKTLLVCSYNDGKRRGVGDLVVCSPLVLRNVLQSSEIYM